MSKRDYSDRGQVAPYWDAYQSRLAELTAAGRVHVHGALAVLPKGARTRGHILTGSVIAKVAA